MPRDILAGVIEQARSRYPIVRTMALVRASRVLNAIDKEEARRIYEEGIAGVDRLNLRDSQREAVVTEVGIIGAAVSPIAATDLFRRQPPGDDRPGHGFAGHMLVQSLAQHGQFELAIALLEDLTCHVEGAGTVLYYCDDAGLKRRALFAARERWRAQRAGTVRRGRRFMQEFYPAVARNWAVLGREEAGRWLDEILLAVESDPAEPGGYGLTAGIMLHSSRDAHLFEVLGMLRELRSADDVEAILGRHPDVAVAAQTFPLGRESVENQPEPPAQKGKEEPSFCFVSSGSGWDSQLIPLLMAAHRGDRSAPGMMLDAAYRVFLEDTDLEDGNGAPLPFWPSCMAYKSALYWAGRIVGSDAKSMVGDVPDRDLALLASVELAAGLLGLNEFPGHWLKQSRRRR